MAFVLIAVTLFFVFTGLFVLMIMFSGLQESSETLREENALVLVSKLANSPEFSCGQAFEEISANCIDSDKVMALSQNSNKYSGLWDVQGIEIRKIYPKENSNIKCNMDNYPECGIIKVISTDIGTGVSNFISLCKKTFDGIDIYDKCELARLVVTSD